jgi:hypothetical protein
MERRSPAALPSKARKERGMTQIMGRSIGLWGVLTILSGAAVLIPSIAALVFALFAVVTAVAG